MDKESSLLQQSAKIVHLIYFAQAILAQLKTGQYCKTLELHGLKGYAAEVLELLYPQCITQAAALATSHHASWQVWFVYEWMSR